MTVDSFLAGKLFISVPTLAAATDFSIDHLDLEVKRGNLAIVGEGRRRRVPAESARKWLASLEKTDTPSTTEPPR